jgi:hypothetical protein
VIIIGNYILKNDAILLRVNNLAMRFFYQNLIEVATEQGFLNNVEIAEFVSVLDQETYGFGTIFVELGESIHSQQMLELLQQLVSKTVEKIKQEKKCAQELIDLFEEFKNKFCALSFDDLDKK